MSKPRGCPFEAGNKVGRGRPRGSRNKFTAAAQELFGENGADVIRKCLRMAKQGDPTAMRLCMERILPARKSPPVRFQLPQIGSIADLAGAGNSILQAIAKGRLTPVEGQQIVAQLESIRRILETEERLRPQVKATYQGITSLSDQELDARIRAIDIKRLSLGDQVPQRDPAAPILEASHTNTSPATKTALPAKAEPLMLPAEGSNHNAGGATSNQAVAKDDWRRFLPQGHWRKP
jgi:hypothetical protein